MDQAMDLIPTDQIPSLENGNDGSKYVLTVILTDLDQAGVDRLTLHLQQKLDSSTIIRIWSPSKQLLRSIARQGPCTDSLANIYALATLLSQSGWSKFVVADGLTQRQVTGNRRLGDKPEISVVMTTVKISSSAAGHAESGLLVVCRRESDETVDSNIILGRLGNVDPKFIEDYNTYLKGDVYKSSVVIHDPDRGIFINDEAGSTGHEDHTAAVTLSLSRGDRSLPAELIADIMAKADGDSKYPVKIPFWEHPQDENHLIIFLLSPASADELAQTQATVNDITQTEKVTVEIIPWERHRISSRRQMMAFWSQCIMCDPMLETKGQTLNFLLGPAQDLISARFGTICRPDKEMPALAVRTTLDSIINEIRRKKGDKAPALTSSQGIELLLHSDEPFYFNPPLWLPATKERNVPYLDIPVFYLTSRLTAELDQIVRSEIESISEFDVDDEKVCCYVPWKKEEDGTLDDIWDIVWEINTYERYYSLEGDAFVCIDWQSGIDKTVLLVESNRYFGDLKDASKREILKDITRPSLMGFSYIRIKGREAHSAKVNLDLANMSIEEFSVDDQPPEHFRRAGWPSRDVLPDSSYSDFEEEYGEVEGGDDDED